MVREKNHLFLYVFRTPMDFILTDFDFFISVWVRKVIVLYWFFALLSILCIEEPLMHSSCFLFYFLPMEYTLFNSEEHLFKKCILLGLHNLLKHIITGVAVHPNLGLFSGVSMSSKFGAVFPEFIRIFQRLFSTGEEESEMHSLPASEQYYRSKGGSQCLFGWNNLGPNAASYRQLCAFKSILWRTGSLGEIALVLSLF